MNMEKSNLSLFFLCFILSVANAYATQDSNLIGRKQVNDWCIALANATTEQLQGFIDYACGVVDCAAIQPGAPCFNPDSVRSHASYTLNLVFKKPGGECNFEIANITITDPSYGDCKYP
ncbi:hypothetical protein CASFOL_026286 [Castilleja foliolosa]|uniref:X8 domain-containing protein n=1 Tax=Castilleja foliolosa TaxID=1961234 RepID=A0ABD3CL86_9LAMI